MTRSKLSTKVLLLVGGIGLSAAAFAGQPAAAQEYTCPDGTVADTPYGCTDYFPYAYDYDYGYLPYGGYGFYRGDHGFGHGTGGLDHGMGHVAHFAGGGFAHGIGGGFHEAASGVAGTARPKLPAETGRAGFPRPFPYVPVTRPGPITRDNPVSINALG